MSLSLWITPESQYGDLRLQDARPGARRRALVEGIKRYLFKAPDAQDTQDAPEAQGPELERSPPPGPEFETVLRAFGESAGQLHFTQPAAIRLWETVIAPPDEDAASDPDTPQGPKGPSFEAVFCMATHGLCQAFAVQRLQMDASDPAEDDAEADDQPATDDAGGAEPGLWAEEALARGIVAALLVKSLKRSLREALEPDVQTSARLIAATLLDCLIAALSDWFERYQDAPGQPHCIRARDPSLARRVAKLLAELPYFYTPQPLTDPVAYQLRETEPADADERDYFRVDLIGYRRTNAFLRRLHAGAAKPSRVAAEFQRYLDAVNLQQAVAWRINLPLLALARRLAAFATDPVAREAESRAAGLDEAASAALLGWIEEAFYKPKPAETLARRKYQRPGEVLDHPLMHSALTALQAAGDGDRARFFLPWKADYRGRIYAETPWLTPQGGDLQRALFEFADGRPLDASGGVALRRHGANLVSRRRLLADLGPIGRQVVTLEERERWVLDHEPEILACAAAPLAEPFWREAADKPMQFLAFCLAYRQWSLTPDLPVHLPVQIDGTCNGLQHIAVLTGDVDLARAVNVLPREDGLPGDIYSEIATAAITTLGRLDSLLSRDTKHPEGLRLADAWLAQEPATWLNRATAKKVIMTIPYGARENSQAAYVAETIADTVADALRRGLATAQVEALCAWVNTDAERLKVVYRLTWRLFPELRKKARSKDPDAAEAERELQRLRVLTAYAARVIVKHLRHALSRGFPSVDRFSAWLGHQAGACAGLPLLWPSPLGFPVCQDKFALEGRSATAKLRGGQSIRVDLERLSERVEPHKQRDALLPNLIHSLDATHLAMTLIRAHEAGVPGIGSIHDCLLCHPNDADTLGRVVRERFAALYRPGADGIPAVLTDWSRWMDGMGRLMPLLEPTTVLGALDHPGGLGEKKLVAEAEGDGDQALAALVVLDLLASLRRLPPSRQWLMRCLVEFLSQEAEPARAQRLAAAGRTRRAAGLPLTTGLPLGGGAAMSDYFFS